MKFEDTILNNIDRNSFPKNLLEDKQKREYFLSLKRQKVDRFRPKLEDFKDVFLFKKEEIEADLQEVRELEEKFRKQGEGDKSQRALQEVAEIYEGVLIDQIEANAWFGEYCSVQIASRYDDIKHGIDGVGVFNQGEGSEYLGLGIDVTFASDIDKLEGKFDSIKAVIRNKELPRIKYFIDKDGQHRSLRVPKVIVGSRLASAEKLIRLWGSQLPDRNQKLQYHSVQAKLIMETVWQLRYFYEYARIHDNEDAIDAYARLHNIFHEVFLIKEDLIREHWYEIQDDVVFQTIQRLTRNG